MENNQPPKARDEKTEVIQAPPGTPDATSPTHFIKTDLLAYLLGGILIISNLGSIFNLYQLIKTFLDPTVICNPAMGYPCSQPHTSIATAAFVLFQTSLWLLGLAIISIKTRLLAQITAFLLIVGLTFFAYQPFEAVSHDLLQLLLPQVQMQIVSLLLAVVASKFLREPSLWTPLKTPVFVARLIKLFKAHWLASALGTLVILTVPVVGNQAWHYYEMVQNDNQEVASLKQKGPRVNAIINSTSLNLDAKRLLSTQEVGRAAKLGLRFDGEGFQICGTFLTNQSHGKRSSVYYPNDAPNHLKGHQCFQYLVSKEKLEETQVLADLLVVIKDSNSQSFSVYPLKSTQWSIPRNLDKAPIFNRDGSKGDATQVKLGNTISTYVHKSLTDTGGELVKVVIDDANVAPHYCDLLRNAQAASATTLCPDTVGKLTIKNIAATELVAQSTQNKTILAKWTLDRSPTAFDSTGKQTTLSQLPIGALVDLTLDGQGNPIQIREN